MPFPLLAAAAPWVLSAIGAALPQIIDAFRSSPTPEEAAAKVKPHMDELIERLVGSGMSRGEAERTAHEQLAPELKAASEKEPMNQMLSMGLSLLGGMAGYKLGGKFGGKPAAPAASKVADTAGDTLPPKAPSKIREVDAEPITEPFRASPQKALEYRKPIDVEAEAYQESGPYPGRPAQRPPDAYMRRENTRMPMDDTSGVGERGFSMGQPGRNLPLDRDAYAETVTSQAAPGRPAREDAFEIAERRRAMRRERQMQEMNAPFPITDDMYPSN